MYLKMVWCYVFILTLLDISLNTKLTAQGKSHGTVHDQWMLIEKVHFQEYAKDEQPAPAEALRLSPAALQFGRRELARPAALAVTLTNTANSTLHLASVAGTTPHFHASFFESKTLAPQANTTFSVVYLGRREGLVSAHLYIHTSLGVHKYPVSAEGVGNEFDVWPLVGVRVPLNASLEPLLTMRNPTDHTIQVTEVYSSSAWLGLQLPGGGAAGGAALWTLPPHRAAPLVRLRLRLTAPLAALHHTHTAYIRIKANITGGGLVVAVEARMTPQQEYLDPLQLRLRLRGSTDPPETWDISVGNSASSAAEAAARGWGARCAGAAFPPRHPHAEPAGEDAAPHGVKSEGVTVTLLRPQFDAFQPPVPAVRLTLDYAKMWDSYVSAQTAEGNGAGGGGATAAWCAGWVRVGRAALPYSVRLAPGGLALLPPRLQFITANKEELMKEREMRVRNDFKMPMRLMGLQYDEQFTNHFHVEETAAAHSVLAAGQTATVGRVRLRAAPPDDAQLAAQLVLRTDRALYTLPVTLAPGRFRLEWEWPNSSDGTLRLGTVGTSSTRRVVLRLHNPAAAPLCVQRLGTDLPGAQLSLQDLEPADEPRNDTRCAAGGGELRAVLTLVAPARPADLAGAALLRTDHAAQRAPVTLRARAGAVRVYADAVLQGAPYAAASTPLRLHSSMTLPMRVTHATLPCPSLSVQLDTELEITAGKHTVGTLHYSPEKLCEPDCYTGLDLQSKEGLEWMSRMNALSSDTATAAARRAALELDNEQLARRLGLFAAARRLRGNATAHLHTSEAVQLPLAVGRAAAWPRLAAGGAGGALGGVRSTLPLRVRLRNPSTRPLLLHALLHAPLGNDVAVLDWVEGWEERLACMECAWADDTFSLAAWQATGGVRTWGGGDVTGNGTALPPLLLEPAAEVEITVNFTPKTAAPLSAKLYLRNNLTIIESVHVWGHGVYPSFELAGRRPGRHSPLTFEMTECGAGSVRRSVVARNTGRVAVQLRGWRLSGGGCAARGFRVWPCTPLTLLPNETQHLTIAFAPDWSLARVPATLEVLTDLGAADFVLWGLVPARLLAACAARAPRPAWDGAARGAAVLLALAALALVLAAAALDAERELRRARAQRPQLPPPRAPLDLRGVAAGCDEPRPAPPPLAAARRKRHERRLPPPLDPQAERRAFERWRAEVLRRADDEQSSEDADAEAETEADAEAEAEADSTPPPEREHPPAPPPAQRESSTPPDEDNGSTGSDTSTPSSERSEAEARGAVLAAPAPRPRAPPAPRCPSPPPRRTDRARLDHDAPARQRAPPKHHNRKEKSGRRRAGGGERAEAAPRDPRPPALRRGATWSEVVAEGGHSAGAEPPPPPPLAPIGSDVRRRADARAAHSLFYYNEPAPAWHDPSYTPATYIAEDNNTMSGNGGVGGAGSGGYGSLTSVWGANSLGPRAPPAWLWGAADPVRPPPGFPAPQPARAYDPFRSLASIWGPGTMDWRRDPADPAPPPADQ